MKKKRSFGQSILDFLGDSSPFMTLVGKAAFLVVLNVCWLVCCVPVVTAGASTAALYAVLLERGEHSYLSAPPAFFRRFRSCFQKATLLWLPFLIAGILLALDLRLLLAGQMMNSVLLLTPLLLAAALWGATLVWLPAVLVRRGGAAGQVLRSAFLLGLGELWRSLAVLALWVLPGIVFLFYARTFLRLAPLWLLVYFALAARLTLALQEPVFKEKT